MIDDFYKPKETPGNVLPFPKPDAPVLPTPKPHVIEFKDGDKPVVSLHFTKPKPPSDEVKKTFEDLFAKMDKAGKPGSITWLNAKIEGKTKIFEGINEETNRFVKIEVKADVGLKIWESGKDHKVHVDKETGIAVIVKF
jgi:hypothetical protein